MLTVPLYLVALDGEGCALRAAEFAAKEASSHGARLLVLHVIRWSPFEEVPVPDLALQHQVRQEEKETAMDRVLLPLLRRLSDGHANPEAKVEFGLPADTILEVAAQEKASHIFVGRHGRGKLAELVFGSVSHDVARRATVPVTVVP